MGGEGGEVAVVSASALWRLEPKTKTLFYGVGGAANLPLFAGPSRPLQKNVVLPGDRRCLDSALRFSRDVTSSGA